jgi:Tfp pilus assembly protein PilV
MRKSFNNKGGFTLIEVLLAGVILIISVSAMTLIYRTATISSLKASNSVKFQGNISLIIQTIQNSIRNGKAINPLSGEGRIDDVFYTWRSVLSEKSGAPARFSVNKNGLDVQPDKFYLWDVYLTVEMASVTKTYEYKELSWQG